MKPCTWTHTDYCFEDCWETSCGNVWCLIEGTPTENGMQFCPYCGKPLVDEIELEAESAAQLQEDIDTYKAEQLSGLGLLQKDGMIQGA